MTKRRRPLLSLTLAVVLTSAATAEALAASAEERLAALGWSRSESVSILPEDVVAAWDYLDNRSVVVHSGSGSHFLVTLTEPCPALESASVISFNVAIASGMTEAGALQVGSRPDSPECTIGGIVRLVRGEGWKAPDKH